MTQINTKNFWIGSFVIAAISIIVIAIFLLRPTVGDGQGTLRVRFSSLDKVNVGTRVTFAGMSVGQVSAIRVLKDARNQKTDASGRFYFYELDLQIDSHVQVYSCDEINLQTAGLFGEKFITIIPRATIGSEPAKLISNTSDPIYVTTSDPIEDAITQIYVLSDKLEQVLDRTVTLLQNNQESVGSAIINIKETFQQLHNMLSHANETGLISAMQEASSNIGKTMQRMNKELQQIEESKTIHHFSTVIENISHITSALNQPHKLEGILSQIEMMSMGLSRMQQAFEQSDFHLENVLNDISAAATNTKKMSDELKQVAHALTSGEGSLGKLLNKDDAYLQVMVVLSKIETLMNDLNQYGLLFASNRNWQKHRAARMGQLSKIKSPEQMVSFFEQEMDQISTALSRMGQAAKETDQTAEDFPKQSETFKNAFRQVLNKLDNLKSMVKLYNEQLGAIERTKESAQKK